MFLCPTRVLQLSVVDRQTLTVAARAFTTVLRDLTAEISMSFQVLKVSKVAPWFQWMLPLGLNATCELDYKRVVE